jgi:hypothetical protein
MLHYHTITPGSGTSMGNPTIQRVHFRQPLSTGELVLAEMSDDTMRILHNGEPYGQLQWKPADVGDAVKVFMQLKRKLSQQEKTARSKAKP